jgi:hypothetical protein
MTQDEQDILIYFKRNPKIWVSANEVSRQVGGKFRFKSDPDWPKPLLKKFAAKNLLEMDASGAYQLKEKKKKESRGPRVYVSPQVAEILKKSGKTWEIDIGEKEVEDEYARFLREYQPPERGKN